MRLLPVGVVGFWFLDGKCITYDVCAGFRLKRRNWFCFTCDLIIDVDVVG